MLPKPSQQSLEFEGLPTLHTERLILSKFEEQDLANILSYAGSPEVAKNVTWQAHSSIADSKAYLDWINQNHCNIPGKYFFVWAIRQKSDGKVIGSIDFKQPYPHSGQFDYALSYTEWNKGIATEAAKSVMSWAFANVEGLVRFQSFCIADNIGSRRVMEKCGMQFEGVRRKVMPVKGQLVDLAYYSFIQNP